MEESNIEEGSGALVQVKSAGQTAWEWTKSLVVALVIWFLLTSLLVQAFRIPSGSMEGTLLVGDFLFVNKALYGAELPIIPLEHPLELLVEQARVAQRHHVG